MDAAWTDALGVSEPFLQFQENLTRLAGSERPILVVGERGTGKELAAQRLHYLSARWDKPLVTVLCPALSPGLLESELFGHEAGAFTGARGRRIGFFERADGGTLFLDEVADMPLPLQDRLLRVIEYGGFDRWTCVWWPPPIAICPAWPRKAVSAPICWIGWRSMWPMCRLCAYGAKTRFCWPDISPHVWRWNWGSTWRSPPDRSSEARPCVNWNSMPGPATCGT